MISETMRSPLLNYKEDVPSNTASCMVTQPLPSADNWTDAYKLEEHTQFIMQLL